MNYFIVFLREDDYEWCVFQTTSEDYANRVFDDLCSPPYWNMELRATEEDVDTYTTCCVLRYDHSQF